MIKPLTSLRFVFAFMVLASHSTIFMRCEGTFLYHLFSEGFVGVSFFFVLSGFILAYSYQERFISGNVGKRSFYISRIARIYPVHAVCILVYIWMQKGFSVDAHYVVTLFKYLTLTQAYTELHYPPTFNTASWSLSCELFFYLLFPFIIAWIAKSKQSFIVCFGLFISAIAVVTFCADATEFYDWLLYMSPYFRIADFGIGIALFNICRSGLLDKWRKSIPPTLLEVCAVLLLFLFYCAAWFIPQAFRHAMWYWIPVAFLIYVFYYQAGRVSKFLSARTGVLLGEISFSFYMVQMFVRHYINRAVTLTGISPSPVMLFIAFVVMTTIVASLFFKYIEKPANKFIKQSFAPK
ncbi:MAG: acyltransferase [Prevotella sp.]|nr:acyltransferase [Prevotella sp.]